MAAPATKTEILDVNRRYHDVAADEYDAKWGISFAENGQEQVVGKLSKLLGARPGPVRALAGDRRRHGLLQPQHAAGGRRRRRHVHRHLPRHARHARGQRRAARAGRGDRRLRRRRAAVRGRELRPRLRPRRAAPPARARSRLRRVPPRAAAGRDAVLRRRALAPGRPHRRRAQARRVADLARLARRAAGAEGAAPERPPAGRTATTTTSSRRSTCTPSCPSDLERHAAAAGFERGARARRGAAGELVRLVQPHAGGQRGPEGDPDAVDPLRAPRLPAAAGRRPAPARGPPAAAALLQPDARGHQAQ